MGDIKEMYHQIFVSPKDRDAFRGNICVAFDAGAKCNNTSLNEKLLQGPDNNTSLNENFYRDQTT